MIQRGECHQIAEGELLMKKSRVSERYTTGGEGSWGCEGKTAAAAFLLMDFGGSSREAEHVFRIIFIGVALVF